MKTATTNQPGIYSRNLCVLIRKKKNEGPGDPVALSSFLPLGVRDGEKLSL